MSDQTLNPYGSPESISSGGTKRSLLTTIVLAVCFLLPGVMLVVQQVAIVNYFSDGIELPQMTHWFIHPVAAILPLALVPIIWKASRWSSTWKRRSTCVVVLSLLLLWISLFGLAIFLPIAAIKQGLGVW